MWENPAKPNPEELPSELANAKCSGLKGRAVGNDGRRGGAVRHELRVRRAPDSPRPWDGPDRSLRNLRYAADSLEGGAGATQAEYFMVTP